MAMNRFTIKGARGWPTESILVALENAGFNTRSGIGYNWTGDDCEFTQPPENRGEITVADLVAGDEVESHDGSAVVVLCTPHPLDLGMMLVIWRLRYDLSISLDSLSPRQEVGRIISTLDERARNLRWALNRSPEGWWS